jgi:hypothetical protein
MNRLLTPRYYRRDKETTRPNDTAEIHRTKKILLTDRHGFQQRRRGRRRFVEEGLNSATGPKPATPSKTQKATREAEESPLNKLNSSKHDASISNGIRESDPATDHLPSKNQLRSVKMNHPKPNFKKLPMRDDTKKRLVNERRNMSKLVFEDSVSSDELRMTFEVHSNKFELVMKLRAKLFGFLRIPARTASNQFELLRMNPALPPD